MKTKDLEELKEYVELMNDSYGNYLYDLIEFYERSYAHATPAFEKGIKKLLETELLDNLQNIRDNATIEEHTETVTRSYRVLEWDN